MDPTQELARIQETGMAKRQDVKKVKFVQHSCLNRNVSILIYFNI